MTHETTTRSNAAGLIAMVVATVALGSVWLRSFAQADGIAFFTSGGNMQVLGSLDGSMVLFLTNFSVGRGRAVSLRWAAEEPQLAEYSWRDLQSGHAESHDFHGFSVLAGKASFGSLGQLHEFNGRWVALRCPDWFLMAAPLGAIALSMKHRWTNLRRRKLGLCSACGYDLRASPDRCPECGTASGASTVTGTKAPSS